jgi:prepilin-type processing-associated H-X9-DG protein
VAFLAPNDEPALQRNLGSTWVVESGRFQPLNPDGSDENFLTVRHDGRSDATFADGHIEAVPPAWGVMPSRVQADY